MKRSTRLSMGCCGAPVLLVLLLMSFSARAQVQNGGFETAGANSTGAAGWDAAGGGGAICTATRSSVEPYVGAYDLALEGQGNGASGPAAIALANGIQVSPGPVTLSFYAKASIKEGGANPQYQVLWFDASGTFLSQNGGSFPTPLSSDYAQESVPLTAPANADHAQLQFILAVGAGPGDHWLVRIDNVEFPATSTVSAPPPVVLNMLVNGDFEAEGANSTGALGWEAAGGGGALATATRSMTEPYTNAYQLDLEGQGSGAAGASAIALQNNIPVLPGPITLSFQAKGAILSGGGNAQVQVTWFGANGGAVGSTGFLGFPTPLTAEYQLEYLNLTAPANADHAQLQFLLAVGAGTADHYLVRIDDVRLGYTNQTSVVAVTVDASKNWTGYMNVSDLPEYGGTPLWGSGWGVADLNATFSGSVLTFTPNSSIDRDNPNDPYWWVDGSGAAGNKTMDASLYVQNDALAGQTVTFSGYCWANTLAAPYSNSATVFIKDFDLNYTPVATVVSNLTAGQFSLTLATTSGHHIQYGFEMVGPNARASNLVSLGSVVLSSNAPPAGPAITTAPANATVLVGAEVTMTVVATGNDLTYQWQKNGLDLSNGGSVSGATTASLTLANCQPTAEANYSVRVSNVSGSVSATNHLTVIDPGHLTVNPSAPWLGYMNWFELPENGGGWANGGPWGTAALSATFAGSALTFTPNTSIDHDVPSDPYWWVAGTGAPNKIMDALMYLQNDLLAGQRVTFTGYCLSNTLVSPYSEGTTVFIKDFAPNYSLVNSVTAPLVPGSTFSISLDTNPGDHIQYGFEMMGPNARMTNVVNLGKLVVAPTAPPTLTVSGTGGSRSLSFPTEVGVAYTLQYKTNLTDAAWQAYTNFTGTGADQVIAIPAERPSGFFRLVF